MELKNQKDTAEACYRQALELQKNTADASPEATGAISLRLIRLLENSDRTDEAKRLRYQLKAESLAGKDDKASLLSLRETALDMFLAGQYAEAEAVYRSLVQKGFEPGSNHCHLARLFLMTDREAEARQEVERAWAARHSSSAYLLVRIQFLRTLLQMLADEEWKALLLEFNQALSEPDAHHDWTMQPVLDHLKPRLGPEQLELLTAMLAAVCDQSRASELEVNPLWREIYNGDECGATAALEGQSSTGSSK